MSKKDLTREKYYRAALDHFDQYGQWPTNTELAFELDTTPQALFYHSNIGEINGEIVKEKEEHGLKVRIKLNDSIINYFRKREHIVEKVDEEKEAISQHVSGGYKGKIRSNGGTISMDTMITAIKNSVSGGLPHEEAKAMAQHIMNFFGYQERIIDNVLHQEDRDVFYMLEDSGLLTTEREETTLYDGREWRTHYWIIKKDKLLDVVKTARVKEQKEDNSTIYDHITEDIWAEHGNKTE